MSVEEKIEELQNSYRVNDIFILENKTDGHNKVYIIVVLEKELHEPDRKVTVMLRFWGAHSETRRLNFMREVIESDKDVDKLLGKKLYSRGYKSVENFENERDKYMHYLNMVETQLASEFMAVV